MTVAFVVLNGAPETGQLLSRFVAGLSPALRISGAISPVRSAASPNLDCTMRLELLPSGQKICISQALGRHSKGCRLDVSALETAVGIVLASLDEGVDLVVVNKFGKQEDLGRGFRAVIEASVLKGIPLVTAVHTSKVASFQEFSGGLSVQLPPSVEALRDWVRTAIPEGAQVLRKL